MLKVLYTVNKVEHKCALSILYTLKIVETTMTLWYKYWQRWTNTNSISTKWVRFSLCQLINKYNMKELIKECFVNYEKWNKFLSLHELNKEESNDKVYLQSLYENFIENIN